MPRRDGDVFFFGTAMYVLLTILATAAGAENELSTEAGLIVDEPTGG
jgi:hypothetical protein